METKPKLYYFQGRGRMESIRWLLAAAGVEVGFWLGMELKAQLFLPFLSSCFLNKRKVGRLVSCMRCRGRGKMKAWGRLKLLEMKRS